jgi:hypothetical protein
VERLRQIVMKVKFWGEAKLTAGELSGGELGTGLGDALFLVTHLS